MKKHFYLSCLISLVFGSLSAFADIDFGSGRSAVKVAPGLRHSCAVLDNGYVKCWGSNEAGQLGLGDTIDRTSPAQMGNNLPYVNLGTGRTAITVAVGGAHTCAILDTRMVKCWGSNAYGQLGFSYDRSIGGHVLDMASLSPVDLGWGRTALSLKLGENFTCVHLDNGSDDCWGIGY